MIQIAIITLLFILLDFLTGLLKAFALKNYDSSIMREGLFHKAGSIVLIILSYLVDYAGKFIDLGVSKYIVIGICSYIILMEIGSIIENVGKINPDIIPDNVKKYFNKLNDKHTPELPQDDTEKEGTNNDNDE